MARKLKVELDFNTARANRKAREANREVQKIGKSGQRAGAEIGQGMGTAGRMTAAFKTQLLGLAAGVVGLAGLERALGAIIRGYERALQLRSQFAQSTASTNRAIAGAAYQFGVSEDAMRQLVGKIGGAAGAGPQDIGGIQSLITAASSLDLISGIKGTAEGGLAIPQAAFGTLTTMEQFIQRTGAYGREAELAKLLSGVLGGQPGTRETVGRGVGRLGVAYRGSAMSNWAEFLKGGVAGTAGLMSQRVDPNRAIAMYAALAKQVPTGMRGGEVLRMIGERFFTAVDPTMTREYERLYGKGSYWRDREQSPTVLFENIMDMLLGAKGPEGAALWQKLGVQAEQSGRLVLMQDVRATEREILGGMRGVKAADTLEDLESWRRGGRGDVQAAGLAAEMDKTREGERRTRFAAIDVRAAAANELARSKDRAGRHIAELFSTQSVEKQWALWDLVKQDYARRGWPVGEIHDWRVGIEGGEYVPQLLPESPAMVLGTPEEYERVRGRLQTVLGGIGRGDAAAPRVTNITIGTQYTNTPTEAANTKLQRGQ